MTNELVEKLKQIDSEMTKAPWQSNELEEMCCSDAKPAHAIWTYEDLDKEEDPNKVMICTSVSPYNEEECKEHDANMRHLAWLRNNIGKIIEALENQ